MATDRVIVLNPNQDDECVETTNPVVVVVDDDDE